LIASEGDASDNDNADDDSVAHSEFDDDEEEHGGESSDDTLPENVVASYEKHLVHEVWLFIPDIVYPDQTDLWQKQTPTWKTRNTQPRSSKGKGSGSRSESRHTLPTTSKVKVADVPAKTPETNSAVKAKLKAAHSKDPEFVRTPTAWWEVEIPEANPLIKAKLKAIMAAKAAKSSKSALATAAREVCTCQFNLSLLFY
jgi:hypothetical protein